MPDAPQVSRDLRVPEAKGLRHLVLLEAKVPTGWKHQSQKLLHSPSVGAAIAGLEDLEAGKRGWGPRLSSVHPTSPTFPLPPSCPSCDYQPEPCARGDGEGRRGRACPAAP